MINRRELVSRHNPIHQDVSFESPLTIGNGDFAFTFDVTGLQSLYKNHVQEETPLCTMSGWGWHRSPVSAVREAYELKDLTMTSYEQEGGTVHYPVHPQAGNEKVYTWLRENPHRFNLIRIAFLWDGKELNPKAIHNIRQELKLYEGKAITEFDIEKMHVRLEMIVHPDEDAIGFKLHSEGLCSQRLQMLLAFPYGSPEKKASDWSALMRHKTLIHNKSPKSLGIIRKMDTSDYYVVLQTSQEFSVDQDHRHSLFISTQNDALEGVLYMAPFVGEDKVTYDLPTYYEVNQLTERHWRLFWEKTGIIDFSRATNERANELERRMVLSLYLLHIQSAGFMPPQETGLTCNSWYGKFHLEMHPWHGAYMPLWNQSDSLMKSIPWYSHHLDEAYENARRNGYKGARWPKMVGPDGVDSPSVIAPLLIWQQPHIIYMLELIYQDIQSDKFLKDYWHLIRSTAEFMVDFVSFDEKTGCYNLEGPIIPAQEEHDPMVTLNPTFEVEYWRFGLIMAYNWGIRIGYQQNCWKDIADHMAPLPTNGEVYLAHENCPTTYTEFNQDHPSMIAVHGFIRSERVDKQILTNTLDAIQRCWQFETMWGWDFAMMAMSALRLGQKDRAIELLLMDTPKNDYVLSGNNYQRLRKDLPLYLPGNGSLLLALGMMAAGVRNENESLGFPDDGSWEVEVEKISPFPY